MEGTTFEPVERNVFSPGETVRVNCGPKFWISDHQSTSAVTTCQEDGEWSLRPSCRVVTCINPQDQLVQHWGVRHWETKRLGDTASYSCRSGYKKSGGVTQATCTRGGWTPKPLCEEIICNKQDVPNAVVVRNDKETYKHNESVRYDCNKGYQGGFTLTCEERGWTGNPECREIICNKQDVLNAIIVRNDKETYKYNERVTYNCTEGYQGEFNLTCGERGWTGNPQCQAIPCRLTLPPMEGTTFDPVDRNVFSPGETVRVNCGPKYWISDHQSTSAVTTCQEGGEWTLRPICQEVTCINPQDQLGLLSIGSQNKLGDRANYRCKRGYKKSRGVTQATCTRDGWTPKPLCEDPGTVRSLEPDAADGVDSAAVPATDQ